MVEQKYIMSFIERTKMRYAERDQINHASDNSYILGWIHAFEDMEIDMTAIRNLAAEIPGLEYLKVKVV